MISHGISFYFFFIVNLGSSTQRNVLVSDVEHLLCKKMFLLTHCMEKDSGTVHTILHHILEKNFLLLLWVVNSSRLNGFFGLFLSKKNLIDIDRSV